MARKRLLAVGLLVLVVALAVSPVLGFASSGSTDAPVLAFRTMVGVTGPFVGAANPIRGVAGGGLPWAIAEGRGELRADGRLEVHVRGLVLAAGPSAGTNPVANFRALVSCQSFTDATPTVVNVSTDDVPATTTGDADIEATVSLPSPCFAPIIFVTNPAGRWFAVTGL
ncbi:MAG TPA: hypothetical protein VG370_04040 [Chloroflexota bacterium]|nr:hypothetical protein [Chloroflexota bacterium]